MSRVLALGLLVVVLVAAVLVLRETTMTVHTPVSPTSRLVVEASARWKGSLRGAENHARALAIVCVSETSTRSELRDFDWHTDGDFRFVVVPTLDEPDRRQLRGCMSDFRMPQLLVDVLSTRTVDSGTVGPVGAVPDEAR